MAWRSCRNTLASNLCNTALLFGILTLAVQLFAEVETILGTTIRVPDTKNLDHAWILTEHANGARAALGLSLFSPHGPYGNSDADLESLDVGIIGEEGKLVAYVRRSELRSWPRSGGKGRVERLAPKQGAQGWHAGGRETAAKPTT